MKRQRESRFAERRAQRMREEAADLYDSFTQRSSELQHERPGPILKVSPAFETRAPAPPPPPPQPPPLSLPPRRIMTEDYQPKDGAMPTPANLSPPPPVARPQGTDYTPHDLLQHMRGVFNQACVDAVQINTLLEAGGALNGSDLISKLAAVRNDFNKCHRLLLAATQANAKRTYAFTQALSEGKDHAEANMIACAILVDMDKLAPGDV